jgi:hypothetical protein
MQKGENIISLALAAVVFFSILAVQRKWNPATLQDAASTAEDFILTTSGIRGELPDIAGYEKLKTFRLLNYSAGLYRATPAPLVFARGRLVIYNQQSRPAFSIETLEGSKDPWTVLYDFGGRRGLTVAGSRAHPEYARNLSGDGVPDVIIGQYSGGDHCCTLATIVALGVNGVKPIGHIDGLDGLPFEGLELRKINKDTKWECIAHRPYQTPCGPHVDAADVISIYAVEGGRYADQTASFSDYLQDALRQNLVKWRQAKNHSMSLLQTLAVEYAALGQSEEGKRFFALNMSPFVSGLQNQNLDPNACLDGLDGLVDQFSATGR